MDPRKGLRTTGLLERLLVACLLGWMLTVAWHLRRLANAAIARPRAAV